MRGLPEALVSLLVTDESPELGPGPRPGVRPSKELQREVAALRGISERNRDLTLGTVLLWHDHLGAAHEIAQSIESADGSYLHAIMHRREPDYSNAKYWFRRVGHHSCYAALAEHVTSAIAPIQPDLAKKLAPGGAWDAFAFVDACEAASGKAASFAALLREIQAAEFTTFLNYLSPTRDISSE